MGTSCPERLFSGGFASPGANVRLIIAGSPVASIRRVHIARDVLDIQTARGRIPIFLDKGTALRKPSACILWPTQSGAPPSGGAHNQMSNVAKVKRVWLKSNTFEHHLKAKARRQMRAEPAKHIAHPLCALLSPGRAERKHRVRFQEAVVTLFERHNTARFHMPDQLAECFSVGSCMCSSTSLPIRASKSRSRVTSGISPTAKTTLFRPVADARARAVSRIIGLESTPKMDTVGRTNCAAKRATSPAPDPTSRTRIPGPIAPHEVTDVSRDRTTPIAS